MGPFIGDRYSAFTFMLAGGCVTANTDLDQLPVVMDQGDIGHTLLVVGVHQLIEHRGAGFSDMREKAHVPGFGGQPFDEYICTVAVLLRQWPDQHMASVLERFNPMLPGDRGVSRRGPVIVVFDGKHGRLLQYG